MGNTKIDCASISCLKNFICNTLNVDLPLYQNNPDCSVRINFEDLNTIEAQLLAKKIIKQLLSENLFWICEYGSSSGKTFYENNFFVSNPEVFIFPFQFTLIDRDWFEYERDSITCTYIGLQDLRLDEYIKYAFRLEFISNTIFLISTDRQIALSIYDRRGMDISSTNHSILRRIRSEFSNYTIW